MIKQKVIVVSGCGHHALTCPVRYTCPSCVLIMASVSIRSSATPSIGNLVCGCDYSRLSPQGSLTLLTEDSHHSDSCRPQRCWELHWSSEWSQLSPQSSNPRTTCTRAPGRDRYLRYKTVCRALTHPSLLNASSMIALRQKKRVVRSAVQLYVLGLHCTATLSTM